MVTWLKGKHRSDRENFFSFKGYGIKIYLHIKWPFLNVYIFIRPDFLLVDLWEFFFRIRVGGRKKKKKKPSENDQLTGYFQSFFFSFFFLSQSFFF